MHRRQMILSGLAATAGVSGLTAYFAVTEECKPGPGHTMVVNGAAGAVGSIVPQGRAMTPLIGAP